MSRPKLALVALVVVTAVVGTAAPETTPARLLNNLTVVAVTVGAWVAVRRAPERRAFAWLAAGLTCWVAGDLFWDAYTYLGRERPLVSIADVWYLLGYPAIAVGVVLLIRDRSPGGYRDGILDGAAFAFAAAIASWELLVVPMTRDATPVESVVWGAYPLVDALLLAALSWLVLAPGGRTRANLYLAAFLAANFVLDIAYAALPVWAPDVNVARLDGWYPMSYALLAAALWQPVSVPQAEANPWTTRMHPTRMVLLGGALLTVPVITVAGAEQMSLGARAVMLGSSCALVATVLARVFMAVRDREAAQEELAHRVAHDDLTGLYNRPLLLETLQHTLDRSGRLGRTVAVLYVDLDRFKPVNDTWGHTAGDEVLVQVAHRLRNVLRPGDVVGRVGGDEFVIACDDVADHEAAGQIAERVVEALAAPFPVEGATASVSASIGITIAAGGGDAGAVVRDADAAMYRAKQRGRNRFEHYDHALHALAARRAAVEAGLRDAIERNELELHYQPIVRSGDRELVGFESLVRWRHDGRIVEAASFMDVAEETGLIVPIGGWVVREACRQLRQWNPPGCARPIWMAVNVSPRQFANPRFVEEFGTALAEAGADPSLLVVEITESVLVDDVEHAARQLQTLSRLGIRIAVDDFGTGYSALAYLRHFPIDIVKIDRQFMREVGSHAPSATMVAAVVHLAHMLGHSVIAEGVENEYQAEAIRAIECDHGQGYFFGIPAPAAAFDALVAAVRPDPVLQAAG